MLVLTRTARTADECEKDHDKITLDFSELTPEQLATLAGTEITICLDSIQPGNRARIGIEAPAIVPIYRTDKREEWFGKVSETEGGVPPC